MIHTIEIEIEDLRYVQAFRDTITTKREFKVKRLGQDDRREVQPYVNNFEYRGINELRIASKGYYLTDKHTRRKKWINYEVIRAIVEPSVMINPADRLRLFTGMEGEQEQARQAFNAMMKEIPLKQGKETIYLPDFYKWKVKRVDYCTNVFLPSQDFVNAYLNLLYHCDLPLSYRRDLYEDYRIDALYRGKKIAPRKKEKYPNKPLKQREGSFYLRKGKHQSSGVNIYNKYDRWIKKHQKNQEKGKKDKFSQEDLERSKKVLRVEYQFSGYDLNKAKKTFIQYPDNHFFEYWQISEEDKEDYESFLDSRGYIGSVQEVLLSCNAQAHRYLLEETAKIEHGTRKRGNQVRRFLPFVYVSSYYFDELLKAEPNETMLLRIQELRKEVSRGSKDINDYGTIWKYKEDKLRGLEGKEYDRIQRQIRGTLTHLYCDYGISPITFDRNKSLKDSEGNPIRVKWLPSLTELVQQTFREGSEEYIDNLIRTECTKKYEPFKPYKFSKSELAFMQLRAKENSPKIKDHDKIFLADPVIRKRKTYQAMRIPFD